MIHKGRYILAAGTYKMMGSVYTRTRTDPFDVEVLCDGTKVFAMINGDPFKLISEEEWKELEKNLKKIA